MATEAVRLVVDRFEGDVAVLVEDDGGVVEVTRAELPDAVGEGDVLRVSRDADGGFLWRAATADAEAKAERLAEAEEVLEQLRRRDPGGDLKL